MTVTVILRLDPVALAEGRLRGWAELMSAVEPMPVDGPESILAAALEARDRARERRR